MYPCHNLLGLSGGDAGSLQLAGNFKPISALANQE